jgi:hypothetical protein
MRHAETPAARLLMRFGGKRTCCAQRVLLREAEFIGKIRLLGVKLPTSILASAFLKI